MKTYSQKHFLQQIADVEGIDITLTRNPMTNAYTEYNGGGNVGRITANARFTTFLERLKTFYKITPEEVLVVMPNGVQVTGAALRDCLSDIRMKALRDYKIKNEVESATQLYGYKVWMSPQLSEHLGKKAVEVSGFHVFEKTLITTMEHPTQGKIFSESQDMRILWSVVEAIKDQMLKDSVKATLIGDVFSCDGVVYQRYVPVQWGS